MNATPDELTAEAGRWLRFAAEDLEAAEALRSAPGVAARHVATLAQQSAEKAVKAGLVLLDVDPPRTHNLELLVDLLPDDWAAEEALAAARDLLATMSSDLSARGVASAIAESEERGST